MLHLISNKKNYIRKKKVQDKKMILIADSGSTKCSWAICDQNGNQLDESRTIGFNPYFISQERILEELEKSSLSSIKNNVTHVFSMEPAVHLRKKIRLFKSHLIYFFQMLKWLLAMILMPHAIQCIMEKQI